VAAISRPARKKEENKGVVMDVPLKAFKLKAPANAQPLQPNAEAPLSVSQAPQPVPAPQTSGGTLKLKAAFVPYQHVPPPPASAQPALKIQPPAQAAQPEPAAQPALKIQPPVQAVQPHSGTQQINQGRLIVHNRASVVPPAQPTSTQVPLEPVPQSQPVPLMTLRPSSINNPPAAAAPIEIPKKPATALFVNIKPAIQKTSVYDVPEKYQIPDMSDDLQKILENESENYKDQVQSFVELCEILSNPGWQFPDIADYIHMLVRSVNLDVLSIVLTEPSDKGKFCKVISRGYKFAPGPQIVAEWGPAVTADATVDWNRLMDIAADKNTKLCKWIIREGLLSVGYVPLHGSAKIHGFLLVGAYENKVQSPLASSLLELCGDRIGIVLETRRSVPGVFSPSPAAVQSIKDQLSLLASYMEVLKISAKASPEDVLATAEKCLKTIDETKKTVESFSGQ
jgi:hypothetical protein